MYPTRSVKSLFLKVEENLYWKQCISNLAIKVNSADTILSKLRHFIDRITIRGIHYTIFEPNLHYPYLI